MANCNWLLQIVRIIAIVAGFVAIVYGAITIYDAFVYSNQLSLTIRWFFAGFFLILFGLFILATEGTSFINFSGELQNMVTKVLTAPLWIRGIVYILFTIPTMLLVRSGHTYPATALMTIAGILYIIVGLLVSTTTTITTTNTV
jgi:uncharacterized membrane protein